MKEILDICLSEDVPEECICQRVPTGITKSAVSVVNLEAVDDKDLTTDDCGIYGSRSSPSEEVDVVLHVHGKVSNFVTVRGTGAEERNLSRLGGERVCVRRHYSWQSQTKDYKRLIVKVVHGGELLRYAIVQYHCSTTKNIHLRCFDHVKTDIVAKLTGLGLEMEERKEILESILGDERNGCRRKGLVDCETEEEFEEKHVNLEVK